MYIFFWARDTLVSRHGCRTQPKKYWYSLASYDGSAEYPCRFTETFTYWIPLNHTESHWIPLNATEKTSTWCFSAADGLVPLQPRDALGEIHSTCRYRLIKKDEDRVQFTVSLAWFAAASVASSVGSIAGSKVIALPWLWPDVRSNIGFCGFRWENNMAGDIVPTSDCCCFIIYMHTPYAQVCSNIALPIVQVMVVSWPGKPIWMFGGAACRSSDAEPFSMGQECGSELTTATDGWRWVLMIDDGS